MAYFLDLFEGGSPSSRSILLAITGSATRPDVSGVLVQTVMQGRGILTNLDTFSIASASLSTINIGSVGIYDAASGGTLLYSARLGSHPTIALGNPVAFKALDLTFPIYVPQAIALAATISATVSLTADLTVHGATSPGQWVFNQTKQSGQILTIGL